MLYREIIDLVSEVPVTNEYGDTIQTETTQTVFADKQSIRQNEFYQAMATGLKPELKFVIRLIDYNNQSLLLYDNKRYNIIRTYDVDGEQIELTCQGIIETERR